MNPSNFHETIKQVQSRKWFDFYAADAAMRRAAQNSIGFRQVVVAYGGYRLIVESVDNILTYIGPKAKSAGRGDIFLAGQHNGFNVKMFGQDYNWDKYGSGKLQEAIKMTLNAWGLSGGDIDEFYKALGQSGHCAICGANLTDELSMSRGIGPECLKKIGVGTKGLKEVQAERTTRRSV